jgi:SAM-dependent methyltransferase
MSEAGAGSAVGGALPLIYGELADWWHLLSDPADYAEEAALFTRLLRQGSDPPPRTVLELGSGGGNNASHMKAHFDLTLTDVSPEMIEVSRSLNPECDHTAGDMRTLRLGRPFDAVFAHDALMYMLTEEDLRATLTTAFVHCRPGGVALLVPDYLSETFRTETRQGGHDGPSRSLRYLQWTHEVDEASSTFVADFVLLTREDGGATEVRHDTHTMGLFPRQLWCALLGEVGFEYRIDRSDPHGREIFVARRGDGR